MMAFLRQIGVGTSSATMVADMARAATEDGLAVWPSPYKPACERRSHVGMLWYPSLFCEIAYESCFA